MSRVSPRRVRYLQEKTAACETVVHAHTRHPYPHPCGGVDIKKLLGLQSEVATALHDVTANDQALDKAETLGACLRRVQELATEVDVAYATAKRQPQLFGQTPTQRTRLQVYVRDQFTCVLRPGL